MEQDVSSTRIPPFRTDGYLPEGVYVCSEAEVVFRFGSASRRRRRLVLRLRRWIDTVILLPQNFTQQLARESAPALELEVMLLTRRPEEIFAAEDETDWQEWVEFFRQTREPDGRRKGLVEIRV